MLGSHRLKFVLVGGVCAMALASGAAAEVRTFNVPAGDLQAALDSYARQSGVQLLYRVDLVNGVSSKGAQGALSPDDALAMVLANTGLEIRRHESGAVAIVPAGEGGSDPQSESAAGDGAEGTVEALIVTAQKREEDIQDVPIAMSAFTQEALTTHQIAGGPDLMTQIPNFTFTKTNFSSYSIQIRGIGTQAISATVDPAVAVAFNNTPFVTNRFFEQEFYDLQRIEVLRGPQGTLYGRNATAGVVNIISAKPTYSYAAKLSADLGNYSTTRLEGMLNIPLVDERLAFRLAGAWTKRDGYVTNTLKGEPTDGRDLWSARATLAFEPTDDFRAWLTYEHFEEDDDRLRSGKQLCTRHDFPEVFAEMLANEGGGAFGDKTYFSQGCQMGSLYEAEAFQVPNGYALPFFGPLRNLSLPAFDVDPYASTKQSQDLRSIETHLKPVYEAKSDIIHLSAEYDLTDGLTLSSETAYGVDELFSFNDYNRFNTTPNVFNPHRFFGEFTYFERGIMDADGVFCDPQLGCSNRLVAADLSTARSDQFSQEFRLSSDFDGPFNFHLGANYLHYATTNKYYVFINTLSLFGAGWCETQPTPSNPWDPSDTDESCIRHLAEVDPTSPTLPRDFSGIYIDRHPINSLDDLGRNYFLSKNPFRLVSYAVFGEAQYELTPDLKVTAGLRFTVDEKDAPVIPTWLLISQTYGLPTKEILSQDWREPTGRLVVDWQPDTAFTDQTLVYGSYAHGYKAGGMNPPLPGSLPFSGVTGGADDLNFISATQPQVFGPEFVDAFEAGTKNTLLDGAVTFNLAAFYYDYEGYQISQIANRSAVNWNIDAEVWGAELEVDWRVFDNLRLGFRGGYEKTRVAEGQSLIDMIDRTAGDPEWFVLKPFPTIPSNCIAPVDIVLEFGRFMSCEAYYNPDIDPLTQLPYVANPTVRAGSNNGLPQPLPAQYAGYPGFHPGSAPGMGAGVPKDLGGNELPNAPDTTMTFTIDYTLPLRAGWIVTFHGDYYRQSEAWTRIFNEDPYDKLKPFSQMNFAAIFSHEDSGLKVMTYIKNLQDKDSITGAFLNSDDSGLTTNVFLNEPRLYGIRVTKAWTGGTLGGRRSGLRAPWLEVSGGVTRLTADAPNETYAPFWAADWEPAEFRLPLHVQNEELDIGDDRDVRVTYRPGSGPWTVSGGYRFGRTNGSAAINETEAPAGIPFGGSYEGKYAFPEFPEFVSDRANNHEKYEIADFKLGRDFGFGLMGEGGESQLALGLRYARFKSSTDVVMDGLPSRYDPPAAFKYGPHSAYVVEAEFHSEREFKGSGPEASWAAAMPLFGNEDTGRLMLDWSVEGGMLFGRQETSVEHESASRLYEWPVYGITNLSPSRDNPQSEAFDAGSFTRSEDVEVPFAGVSLGLSYKIERFRVSTGYRYETYFDAIDAGIDEAMSVDRTLQGPYLRVTVGFGG